MNRYVSFSLARRAADGDSEAIKTVASAHPGLILSRHPSGAVDFKNTSAATYWIVPDHLPPVDPPSGFVSSAAT